MRKLLLIGLLASCGSGLAAEFTFRQVETIRSSDPHARTIETQRIKARRKDGAFYSGETGSTATAALQLPDERRRIVMDTSVNRAPELACLSVRSVHKWKDQKGNITGETVRETVELKLGAPDPSLFVVPAGLVESKPSESRDARYRYTTHKEPPYGRQSWQDVNRRLDAQYEKAVSGQ
jgi:hypothetical protein